MRVNLRLLRSCVGSTFTLLVDKSGSEKSKGVERPKSNRIGAVRVLNQTHCLIQSLAGRK